MPGGLAQLRAFDFLRRVHAARRQNFDERDEFPRREFRAQHALVRDRNLLASPWARAAGSSTMTACERCDVLQAARLAANFLDVLRPWCRSSRRRSSTPAIRKRRAYCAMYSGEHKYMLRPSTVAGSPALGIALSGLLV